MHTSTSSSKESIKVISHGKRVALSIDIKGVYRPDEIPSLLESISASTVSAMELREAHTQPTLFDNSNHTGDNDVSY